VIPKPIAVTNDLVLKDSFIMNSQNNLKWDYYGNRI